MCFKKCGGRVSLRHCLVAFLLVQVFNFILLLMFTRRPSRISHDITSPISSFDSDVFSVKEGLRRIETRLAQLEYASKASRNVARAVGEGNEEIDLRAAYLQMRPDGLVYLNPDFAAAPNPKDARDNAPFARFNEVMQLWKRHAVAVNSHVNRDPDILLDPEYGLSEQCKQTLRTADEYCDLRCDHEFKGQYGQDWLHNFVRNTDLAREGGFYVDVGACTPWFLSNSWFLDHCLGWKGICIEPSPKNAEMLREQRTCTVVEKCVNDRPMEVKFTVDESGSHIVQPGETDPLWRKDPIQKVQVPCDTLQSMLEELGVVHVDYMSVDVEMTEFKALSVTDLQQFGVDVVTIEAVHVPEDLTFLMQKQGYYLMESVETDDFFIRGMKNVVPVPFDKHSHSQGLRENRCSEKNPFGAWLEKEYIEEN